MVDGCAGELVEDFLFGVDEGCAEWLAVVPIDIEEGRGK
jgi:hypothetical protein